MKKVAAFLVLALASIALVACGGGDDDTTAESTATTGTSTEEAGGTAGGGKESGGGGGGGGGGSSTLAFEADPEGGLAYTSDTATSGAGKVTVDFKNPQALTHDVAIEDSGGGEVGKTELIAEGSDSTTVELKPGSYTFYCTVPGHREAGMEGALTVK